MDRREAIESVFHKYVEPIFIHAITAEEKEFDEEEWDFLQLPEAKKLRDQAKSEFMSSPRRLSDEKERVLWRPMWRGIG